MRDTTIKKIRSVVIGAALGCLLANTARGQMTLYDNLDLPNDTGAPGGVIGPRPGSDEDRFFAQQFYTSAASVVSSADFLMQRVGAPSGTLHFEIYEDENGVPGSKVDRLGSLDIATLATQPTTISIDGSVSLEPNTPYFLVSDTIDMRIPNPGNSFRFGMRRSDDGTFESARTLVSAPNDLETWLVLGNLLSGSNYMKMRLSAAEFESLFGDFDNSGALDVADIDLLSQRIQTDPTDILFDLNDDGTLTGSDREVWVQDLAGTFFGDTDLSRKVDFADFLLLADSFGQDGGWGQGDFDGDGKVDFPDFLELSANFGMTSSEVAAVPEPTCLALVSFGMLGLTMRRRRRAVVH